MNTVQKLFIGSLITMSAASCGRNASSVTQEQDTIQIHSPQFLTTDFSIKIYPIDSAKQESADTKLSVKVALSPVENKLDPGFGTIQIGKKKLDISNKKTYDDIYKLFKKYSPADSNSLDGIEIKASAYELKYK